MAIGQASIEVSIEIATREVFSMNTADGVDGFRSTTCPLHGLPKRYQGQASHQKGMRMEREDGRRGSVGSEIVGLLLRDECDFSAEGGRIEQCCCARSTGQIFSFSHLDPLLVTVLLEVFPNA